MFHRIHRQLALSILACASTATALGAQCDDHETEILHDTAGSTGDGFGQAVAATALHCVIGAPEASSTGAALIFLRAGGAWVAPTNLVPGDGSPGDRFGGAVAIDGSLAVVGAAEHEVASLPKAGAVYVYRFSGGSWVPEAKLTAPFPQANSFFGQAVSVSGDRIAVAAPLADSLSGKVTVFRYSGSWNVEGSPATPSGSTLFGASLSLDRDRLLVGSPYDDTVATDAGAAYLYRYTGSWLLEQQLLDPAAATADRFGAAVSLDGSRAAVGAPGNDVAAAGAGAVLLFQFLTGTWTGPALLTAHPSRTSRELGASVDLAGTRLLAGAPTEDSCASQGGAAYLWHEEAGTWNQNRALSSSNLSSDDALGTAVALSGTLGLVGAVEADSTAGSETGAVYSYLATPKALAADSYYQNSLSNGLQDQNEFAADLGGIGPMSAYDDTDHHWNQVHGSGPLRQLIYDHITELPELDAQIRAATTHGVGVLPAFVKFLGSETRSPWWTTAPDSIRVWRFRINGAPVLVARKDPPTLSEHHILIVNLPKHDSDFRSNRLEAHDIWNQSTFPWFFDGGGQPNLIPREQALERGDLVAVVMENKSADFWTALLRSQDTENFLRTTFVEEYDTELDGKLGWSFVDGGSWGAWVASVLALLQPSTYAGSLASFTHDAWMHVPGIGEFNRLQSHMRQALGLGGPMMAHSNRNTKDLLQLVDMLGIRFDDPDTGFGMKGWDVSVLAAGRRPPSDVMVPIHRNLGDEDMVVNPHWDEDDHLARPLLQRKVYKNGSHGNSYGVVPGMNEHFLYTGDEWQDLLDDATTQGGPASSRPPIEPTTVVPASEPVRLRPYGPTLRPTETDLQVPAGPVFLKDMDLNMDSATVGSIGQGTWIGAGDGMQVADIDGDGRLEVLIGNFEGHYHVLELDESSGSPLLLDEYKSPHTGWGMTSGDLFEHSSGAWTLATGNGSGEVHSLEISSGGVYSSAALATGSDLAGQDYEGQIQAVYTGSFLGGSSLNVLVLTEQMDWVLRDVSSGWTVTLRRSLSASGPGRGCVIREGGKDVLYLPCLDGHLWKLSYDSGALVLEKRSEFLGHALYRAEALSDSGPPTELLLFGRDDERVSPDLPNRALLVDLSADPPEILCNEGLESDLSSPSFDWLHDLSGGVGTFVVGGGRRVERIRVDLSDLSLDDACDIPLFDPEAAELVGPPSVTSLEVGESGGQKRIFLALSNGRIYVLDEDLNYLRLASSEWDGDGPSLPSEIHPWPSNRTLAQCFSMDLYKDGSGRSSLYFAEMNQPMFRDGSARFRVGRLKIRPLTAVWDPLVDFTAPKQVNVRDFSYQDLDGDSVPEARYHAETGTAYFDASIDDVRSFENLSLHPRFVASSMPRGLGGYVFEQIGLGDSTLTGFHVPAVPGYFHNGSSDWAFGKIGSSRITGQIACNSQTTTGPYSGTSMTWADVQDPANPEQSLRCIVTGTIGGFVYVIAPGPRTGGNKTPSSLLYASADLGHNVIGLDAADLDGDGFDEIVVGTLLDDGSRLDHLAGLPHKNRGHVLVLEANPVTGMLDIDADLIPLNATGERPSTGFFGVCIDDVDADGEFEIWAGDATGCLHLFGLRAGAWTGLFKSRIVAPYVGAYNNLFPVKDDAGLTRNLLCVSPGYVDGFRIRWKRVADF